MNRFQRLFGRSIWQSAKGRGKNHTRRLTSGRSNPRAAAEVDRLEERLVLSPGLLAVGSDAGIITQVNVFDSVNGFLLYQFNPYSDVRGFAGGARTAVGYIRDVNGNPTFPVIITAPGPGLVVSNPVRVFAGVSGQLFGGRFVRAAEPLATLNPYPGFGGGIYLAAADFDLDGVTEVVTGAGEGGGPHVRVQSLATFNVLFNAFVYDPRFLGGVRVATGQIDPAFDPFPDLITAAGPGGGPHVKVFSGFNGVLISEFFAYNPFFLGGVYVASADFTGDGRAEIVTGAGAGGGPHVRIIDPLFLVPISELFAFEASFRGGVRVAAAYLGPTNSDVFADLIVARGPGFTTFPDDVIAIDGATGVVLYSGPAFVPRFFGGSFPSSGKLQLFLGEALQVEGRAPEGTASQITTADAEFLVAAALGRLEAAGVSQTLLDELGSLEVRIADLPGSLVGLASETTILLDDDAAGFGWYIDPTPYQDEEFGSDGQAVDPEAQGRVDLFTVLLHEIGHQLGLDHTAEDPDHFMAATLNAGERRLPSPSVLDVLFAGDSLLDQLMAPTLL